MSQTGTPTEFLKLGITEPDDTLNVLVDLNGQWQKIDTGVKNVDTKANTNASGISALNTAVQDNTENITNILETNVNQQTSIDTLQSKVATLEEDDTSYGSRITAVEAGVQENSELINDLKVDLSGVKTSVGTVPEGSNLQGEVNGLDTRVTALENSGSVSALETRVTTLETEVGTVPSGETVQGQITTLNGQVNSGNIPFRFSVNGEGTYGYLKADDSFVPFSVGGNSRLRKVDTNLYGSPHFSYIVLCKGHSDSSSPNYKKVHDLIRDVDYTVSEVINGDDIIGSIIYDTENSCYIATKNGLTLINGSVVAIHFTPYNLVTRYLLKNGNNYEYHSIDFDGNSVDQTVSFTIHGLDSQAPSFLTDNNVFVYKYNNTIYSVSLNTSQGTAKESTDSSYNIHFPNYYFNLGSTLNNTVFTLNSQSSNIDTSLVSGKLLFTPCLGNFYLNSDGYYYMLPS